MQAAQPALLDLPQIECAGSARQMGNAHGEALRHRIQAFVDQRLTALSAYLNERGGGSVERFLHIGARCLEVAAGWDPEGHAEQLGIAEAAGVPAADLYAVGNMTDVRDVLLLGDAADREGCSAVLVPPSGTRDGELLVGQTWDLNPTDLDFVVAIHRRPDRGPESWSVTCTGCLSLMGMNAEGVAVGTTNVKVRGARVGVGYLSVLHAALATSNGRDAARRIEGAPRAAAHTYWAADAADAVELECSPGQTIARKLDALPLARTNHCLHPAHVEGEGEEPTRSSRVRLERLLGRLSAELQDTATLRRLFADRSDGVDSVNRYPEDEQGTTTNACMIAVPARRELFACRGPADRGRWERLELRG